LLVEGKGIRERCPRFEISNIIMTIIIRMMKHYATNYFKLSGND